MASSHLERLRTTALQRGGSSAHRDKDLGRAIAAAIKARHTMEEIQRASQVTSVQRVVDLATIGGFVATCTSDDFREAASFLDDYGALTLHQRAVAIRVKAMLIKMADNYDATIRLNARKAKEQRR